MQVLGVHFSKNSPLDRIYSFIHWVGLKLNLTLARKLALSILIVTALTTFLIIWQTEQDTYQLLLDIGKAQARAYLSGVEQEIQLHAPDLQPGKVQEIVTRSANYEPENLDFRIEHLFVLDRQGHIIASNQPEHLGASLLDHSYVEQAMQENQLISPDGLTFRTPAQGDDGTPVPTIDVVMPLHIQDMTKPVGSLELEIDLSASAQLLKKRYWDIRRDLLGKLGLVMVSFGVLSFLTLRRQIVTRITDIARVAHSISRGDLRRRVRDMGPDEIGALAGALNQMTDSLENTIADLKHTQYLTMTKLAELAEKRDPDTGAHLQRMPRYCQVLAQALRCDSPYAELLDDEFIQTLIDSSPLHDIGKVAVPDRILLKPGPLTADEFAIMQRHPLVGADVLTGAGFLKMACDMALCHHERYDGSGYPNHLAGDRIPLAARIIALADMYDALTSRRVYKEAYTHEEAFALIREPSTHEQASAILAQESGRRFDPHVMQAFLRCESEFRSIREQLSDL